MNYVYTQILCIHRSCVYTDMCIHGSGTVYTHNPSLCIHMNYVYTQILCIHITQIMCIHRICVYTDHVLCIHTTQVCVEVEVLLLRFSRGAPLAEL